MSVWKPAAVGNYQTGRRNPISRITFHHIVGDAPAAIAKFQTPGVQVSATYVIGSDGTVYQCVKEADTAYCDGSADSNSRTISIEHAGPPYAEAMYKASITLVADLIKRYGINDFKRHRDVIDKSVYPGGTACPGELNVERIVNEAKKGGIVEPADYRTNEGDVINGFKTFDRVPSELDLGLWTGQPFKKFLYEKVMPGVAAMPPSGTKPYDGPQLLVKS